MRFKITFQDHPVSGVTDKGEEDGVLRAGSDDLAREYIALAHGYGDWDQLCREIPDAAQIVITKLED